MTTQHPSQVQIMGPIVLEFQPQHIQALLQGLQELPYKVAQPIILGIERQLIEISQRQADQARATPAAAA